MARASSIRLSLPLPPRQLSPNWRGHWAPRSKAVSYYRRRAEIAAWSIPAGQRPGWIHATAQLTFYLPTRRRRDRDNLLASMKAAFDGLVDAGILADDAGLVHLPVRLEIDHVNPRVEVELKRLGAPIT